MRDKMKAAQKAKADACCIAKPDTIKAIVDCTEKAGECYWAVRNLMDPETGLPQTFIEVVTADGEVLGTFDDLFPCPPVCCPPFC